MSNVRMRGVQAICCIVVMLLVGALNVMAEAPLKVGERYRLSVDSSKPEGDLTPEATTTGFRWTLTHTGATYIAIHFEKFDLGPGEELVISDGNGRQEVRLSGLGKMDLGTFWAQHVKGDTAVMEFITSGSKPGKGFKIDEYAAGFVSLGEPPLTDEICGVNDFQNAICRSPSIEYTRGRAVARLLIQGASLCTGWLASPTSHLITNNHCIGGPTAAANTDYEFGSEAPTCGAGNCQLCYTGTIFSGASFIQTNSGLDYTLVRITSGNPAATFGFLEIDNRTAVVGEQIYLVSHPGGRAKEFAYNSSGDVGNVGRVLSLNEPSCTGGALEIGYNNDTEGGSSGSPVIAVSSQKVIALHHCRGNTLFCGDPNRAVPIDLICAQICGLLGTGCSTDPDCTGGQICCGGACRPATCSSGAECNDGVACTADVCNNPGTCTASCSNTWAACGLNDGCCGPSCTSANDPNCCRPKNAACTADNQCCGNKCRGGKCR
jgi:hypothetical protein